ncbi:unnamed protein product [Mytilus edulis]|uniref:Uncharacterized protein n=1 Tax=Mytilus edulis TaxID=6550 RepID=A0A8S3R417_MYTED|nr:unnamed protein product [Mytilus edulis]
MERQKLTILDTILSKDEKVDSINLDGYIRSIMDLLTSSRERAIIIFTLALIFLPNKMRDLFDIRGNDIAKCTETIIQYAQDLDSKHGQALRDGKSHFHDVIAKLEENILVKETKLQDKMETLHEIEKTNQQQDMSNMTNRLINIKLNERNWIRRVASAEMRKWKMQLMKQYNKGYGKYRIDQGAELAVFNT